MEGNNSADLLILLYINVYFT